MKTASYGMSLLPEISAQLAAYARLMRLDRPIGIYLLLWPVLWSLWIAAEGFPSEKVLLIFFLGTVLMRSAGCIINDFADRNFDGRVKRTRDRPMATGAVTKGEAVALFAVLVLLSLYLVLLTNWLTIGLSVIAVLLTLLYPFMKRYTYFPQIVLGAAFSMAIPMAFAAQTGTVPDYAWLIYIANLLWVMVYDTMYAMADREDDLKIGIKSTAILFGESDRLMVGILQALTLLSLWVVGYRLNMNSWFGGFLCLANCFFLYQQFIIRNRDRDLCLQAFLNNHWVGMSVFLGIAFSYAYA